MTQEEIELNAHLEADKYKDDEDENSPFIEQTAFNSFKSGIEFAQSKMYSEKEVLTLLLNFVDDMQWASELTRRDAEEWFETIKKK